MYCDFFRSRWNRPFQTCLRHPYLRGDVQAGLADASHNPVSSSLQEDFIGSGSELPKDEDHDGAA